MGQPARQGLALMGHPAGEGLCAMGWPVMDRPEVICPLAKQALGTYPRLASVALASEDGPTSKRGT